MKPSHLASAAILVAVASIAAYVSHNETKAWDEFAVAHRCKSAGEVDRRQFTELFTPKKVAWTCDDGETYLR
ncbi:hypothetical protein L9Z73_03335 [Pseudomonas sp. TNT11]|uniref:Entry exclusion lipoprotein TrbK n=1 Tax=Pseudomonas emilianonis TaxID=2915812 RepID=A0ABT0ECI3_9PSED|nr:hypothetical protein [Pseudomonas emilianonis]MCK1783426.1 hypothetical protein [Pseudomonas emilianonis]